MYHVFGFVKICLDQFPLDWFPRRCYGFAAEAVPGFQERSRGGQRREEEGTDPPLSVPSCLVVLDSCWNLTSDFGNGSGLGSSERWAEWRGGIS